MRLILRIFLALVSLLILFVLFFVGSLFVGDAIARGPMDEVRTAIQPGMSHAEVVEIYSQDPSIYDYGSKSTMQLSQASNNITSPIVGSWFCFVKVHLEDDKVTQVDTVTCVD